MTGFFTIATDFSTAPAVARSYNSSMNEALLTDRRDQVIDRLSADYANGAFEVDELERRLALAHAAQTPAELDALTTDLAPLRTTALVPAQRVRVILGSIERTGPWTVPHRLSARVLLGNLVLDLRDARFSAGDTTIHVRVTMGNLEVIVPPGVHVDVQVLSVLGNIEERTELAASPASDAPRIRIVGRVRLGNLELSTMRRSWHARHAARRGRSVQGAP